ncbi:MAG: 7-carboxy-7-deazaguanine synthase QueE [Flavobacteriales bacterium]|jgi:7-carboxy-7-deazaguanine synthase
MPVPTYPILEHFSTLQGEGMHTGKSAYFIRLSGCDVGCVWCDVKESWDVSNGKTYDSEEIASWVKQESMVVLTGGEPAMYDLTSLVKALKSRNKFVAIETSGCYPLQGDVDWYTFSPKKFKAPCQEAYDRAHELKVIIYHPSDFEFAEYHASKVNGPCQLFLQPEWSKRAERQDDIIAYIKKNPAWRLSLQTHKYLNIP